VTIARSVAGELELVSVTLTTLPKVQPGLMAWLSSGADVADPGITGQLIKGRIHAANQAGMSC
jgi:hypothetical protein